MALAVLLGGGFGMVTLAALEEKANHTTTGFYSHQVTPMTKRTRHHTIVTTNETIVTNFIPLHPNVDTLIVPVPCLEKAGGQ